MPSSLFPEQIVDLRGSSINVRELALERCLVVITLKATWCPVCPVLLRLLNISGLFHDKPKEFHDPFSSNVISIPEDLFRIFRHLLRNDAYFIVISPGPRDALLKIQKDCDFERFPFILDEDLSISTRIGLRMSEHEVWPCILAVDHTLRVMPIKFGRGPGFYGHYVLLQYLHDRRCEIEEKALQAIGNARNIEARLREWSESQMRNFEWWGGDSVLPHEVLMEIIGYLEPKDILRASAVSRRWRLAALEWVCVLMRNRIVALDSLLPTVIAQQDDMPKKKAAKKDGNGGSALGMESSWHGVIRPNVSVNTLKAKLAQLEESVQFITQWLD
ncbi:uncharacterized protein VTP21DRAFT_11415 [Calcarisporiella thermophila]|uniref:uncharacterized protein n=1 Tax=Calcarisporiella thermophila TaxID=911321 RepID=UPI00374232C7